MPKDSPLASARLLGDGDLLAALRTSAGRRREALAALVAHVGELEARDLHLRQGYASVFIYARDALGLPEHEAYALVATARAARRFPVILELLAEGAVHLTSVKLLARCLTPENHREVLQRACGKTRAQVEEIAAALAPEPEMPYTVRKLLAPGARPSAADRYQVQVTVGGGTMEKLRLARDMLRHTIPSGDHAAVLERALSVLLADLARKKFAATDHPRPSRPAGPDSRRVPAEVQRVVWVRDLGRCAFVGEGGHRCEERAFLEFHHVEAFAEGGAATADNIELRCRQHNDYDARARGLA